MNVSNRAQQLTPSVTLAAAAKAKALKAKGVDVLSLTVGEPDFVTPKNIQKAAIASIEDGRASYYTPSGGIPELKQAIVSYVEREYQLRYQPKQVIVTDGAKYALYLLFQAILNVGDEVIIPVPYWVSYGEQVKLAEGKPVFVSSTQEQSFKVSVAQLEAVRTDKTKAIILNSPSNPTGVIYTEEELRQIGEWAVAHNILIIADDIYGALNYTDNKMPICSYERSPKRVITVYSYSKDYSMTGLRLGHIIASKEIIDAACNACGAITFTISSFSQRIGLYAIRRRKEIQAGLRAEYQKRMLYAYERMSKLNHVKCFYPEGTFYIFADIKETGISSMDMWDKILDEAHVLVLPGDGFGQAGEGYIRICCTVSVEVLKEAFDRVEKMDIFR